MTAVDRCTTDPPDSRARVAVPPQARSPLYSPPRRRSRATPRPSFGSMASMSSGPAAAPCCAESHSPSVRARASPCSARTVSASRR
eukprot:6884947-Prymnesium_polylepis.1